MSSKKRSDDFTLRFEPHQGIPGVTKTALWKSWKEVRERIRDSSLRDIVDFIEFDVEPDKWIGVLLTDLRRGSYLPSAPRRFPLGKSKGFSRWMTLPDVRDLVVFHAIATQVVNRASRHHTKPKHVYFQRDHITKAQVAAMKEAKTLLPPPPQVEAGAGDYVPMSRAGYKNWLRFHQYRKWLLFEKIYPFIIKTDITNFFDSIAHAQIEAVLFELGFQRNVVGLLLLLLERLSIRDSYSPAPRVGIPVDEFDCSRCLAHVVLFSHDERMVKLLGEEAYTRWMDDQVFGLPDEGACYRALAELNSSLRRMHLTPNASKTRILTLAQARRDLFFVVNDQLDRIDAEINDKKRLNTRLLKELRKKWLRIWKSAIKNEGIGEWNKILKRCYRIASRLKTRLLVRRAHEDMIQDPALAGNIAAYLRTVCDVEEFVARTTAIVSDDRNVYDDVRRRIAEEVLRLEPKNGVEVALMRRLALDGLGRSRATQFPGDIVPLLVLRYCDKRSVRRLQSMLLTEPRSETARARSLTLASYGVEQRAAVVKLAQQTLHGPLGLVASLLSEFEEPPASQRWKRLQRRLNLRFDSALGKSYIDMRSVLQARLMMTNGDAERDMKVFVKSKWLPSASTFEVSLLRRLHLI